MEVEDDSAAPAAAASAEASCDDSRLVMAGPSVHPSVSVQLHPLVIMNISDHWTRIRAQNNGQAEQVFGALLGKQQGRTIEVFNSFELNIEGTHSITINVEFLENQQKQYRQVFQDLELVGWYTTGGEPTVSDVKVHQQICAFNDSAILMKLDPTAGRSNRLPIAMFESVIEMVDKEPSTLFITLPNSLVTEEGERIGLDNMARLSVAESQDNSLASQHLRSQHCAIKMLHSRIKILQQYVKAVEQGILEPNRSILREIFSLCRQLPVVETDEFRREFHMQCNDVALQTFLATLTKCCDCVNTFVNSFNVLYDRNSLLRRKRPNV
ncbi:COP9 signalosome complex subunit 6 [Galendromus occidentalis]|uniref:COP9 signalosome complex subunit 6 n=1 Tax=Galendromus occidentalis TaxID=34638 RepID=A0AAJ6VWQ9_9ACAR|nr:COP9 signalosome complex subunit 6 [Galendromus occidentalis]